MLVSVPIPGTELQNPWNSLGYKDISCSSEAALGGLQIASRWQRSLERLSHDWKLGTFSPPPIFWEGESAGDWVTDWPGLCDKSLHKNPNSPGFKECVGWQTSLHAGEGHTPTPWGQKLLCSRPFFTSPCVSLYLPIHEYPFSHPLLHNILKI